MFYGCDPNGGLTALGRLIYDLTESGASVEQEDGGLAIWAEIEGSDAKTTIFHPPFPMHEETLLSVLRAVDKQAQQLWHAANCKDGFCQCPGKDNLPLPANRMAYAGSGVLRSSRKVQIALTQEDWEDGKGDIYALSFVLPNVGRFELMNSLEELATIIEDARGLVMEEQLRRGLEDEKHDTTPDDHPGFSADFLTF